MSQDEPTPQSPSPQPQQRSPLPNANDKNPQTNSNLPTFFKAQTIKVLRGTIRNLEKVVVTLEAPVTTTAPNSLDKPLGWWSATLAKIRSFLPENFNQKLSDTALTGMIAGISVILVWITSAVLTTSPQPPQVVSLPTPASEPVSTPTITTPPELTAPATPAPVEIIPLPTPEATPTPTVELTPEQKLIASIQNQITDISDRFGDGLVQSIQANFEGSSLTIKVGDDWYKIKQLQQDKLADRMLEQARELDFTHLKITDLQGTLLARNPVVGNNMVIVVRSAYPTI